MHASRAWAGVALWASAASAQPLGEFLTSAASLGLDAQVAEQQRRQAEAEAAVGWSGLLPRLSGTAGWTRNQYEAIAQIPDGPLPTDRKEIVIAPKEQWDAALKVEVPLVDVAGWLRASATHSAVQAAEGRWEVARDGLRREVIRSFYEWVGAQALHRAAVDSVAVAQAQLKTSQARRSAGTGSELDELRALAEVERAKQALADGEVLKEVSGRRLLSLSGLAPRAIPALAPDDLREEPGLAWFEARLEGVPEAVVARRQAEVQGRQQGVAWAALLPSISAQATERVSNATGFAGQRNTWNAGINAAMRLDLVAVQNIRSQRAAAAVARLGADKARQQAHDRVFDAWHRVQAAADKLKAARAQSAAAKKAAEIAGQRYAAGVATQVDSIQAERDAFSSEVARIQAESGLAQARAELRLSAGFSPEEDLR